MGRAAFCSAQGQTESRLGNVFLLNGITQNANREIGVPRIQNLPFAMGVFSSSGRHNAFQNPDGHNATFNIFSVRSYPVCGAKVPRIFQYPVRHSRPARYNQNGNLNLRVWQYAGIFPFYILEFMTISFGLSITFGEVTVEGLPASQYTTSSVPAAKRDLLTPHLQFQILFPEAIFMARKLLILVGLFFAFSISARAQGIDLFGGYSYERLGTSPGRNLNGVEITGQYKFTNWLGAAADLDAHFGLPSQPDGRTLQFMVGPQLSFPARISPFVHALVGVGHLSDNGIESTSFAGAVGGGIDMRIAPAISWRIIQLDDVLTHHFGGIQHNARASTGLVIRF